MNGVCWEKWVRIGKLKWKVKLRKVVCEGECLEMKMCLCGIFLKFCVRDYNFLRF